MENLIPVNYDAEQPTVSARDLHGALGHRCISVQQQPFLSLSIPLVTNRNEQYPLCYLP